MYDEGISRVGDLIDIAVEFDVVEKRGSYYYHDGESLAQGRENAKQFLREHPEVADQIEAVIRQHLSLGGAPLPIDGDEKEETEEIEELESLLEM